MAGSISRRLVNLALATIVFALGGTRVMGDSIAGPEALLSLEERVRQAAQVSYIHGMTDEIARREVGPDGVPYLLELLRDPGFPRRDNVVAMLAFLGSDATTPHLLDFVKAPPASPAVPEEDRALLLTPDALGRIASRGNPSALDALLDMVAPGGRGGVLHDAVGRGSYPERIRNDLVESAVRGLGMAGCDRAVSRLQELAEGWTQPVVESLELSGTAKQTLDQLEARRAGPARTRELRRKLGGESNSEVPSPNAALLIDPVRDSRITWARHVDERLQAWDDDRVDDVLRVASIVGAQADTAADFACCMSLSRQGLGQLFGSSGDGLDVISSELELVTVLDDPVARVKLVRAITWCGESVTNVLGCSYLPGHGMAVVELNDAVYDGKLWLHEYGHNVGLPHTLTNSIFVMYPYLSGPSNHLKYYECDAYRYPPPQALASVFNNGQCVDGDGDGVFDHVDDCPVHADPGQEDTDEDEVGDACDNCPDHFNGDQSDADQDGPGDPCDNCPAHSNPEQSDGDDDTLGDACDPCPGDFENDDDGDRYCESDDNCPNVPNPDQNDGDGDNAGDACDNCLDLYNPRQVDGDNDTLGNACDPCPDDPGNDDDGDGHCWADDNCPDVWNQDQANSDSDGHGDECDVCPYDPGDDWDGDGLCADTDNCPVNSNADQSDRDDDGLGDACDECPDGPDADGDDLACPDDVCPYDPDNDADGDGLCSDIDTCPGIFNPEQLGTPLAPIDSPYSWYAFSPNGVWVVLRQDLDTGNTLELYSIPVTGGAPIKLNGPLEPDQNIGTVFSISADSSWVVYVTDQETDGPSELYSVPIEGGQPVKLNGPLEGSGVQEFLVSPDSSTVVYRAIQGSANTIELFSVPIRGGVATKISGPTVTGSEVKTFVVSPDSSRVVFTSDQETEDWFEPYSVAIDGGATVKLNPPMLAPHSSFAISPDSSTVVYRAAQDTPTLRELYAVAIDGGTSVKLNGPMMSTNSIISRYSISADSARVVYSADQDTFHRDELYSVSIAGGTAVRLNAPLLPHHRIGYFQISSDSSFVVYKGVVDIAGMFEIYSVPIEGGVSTKLNGSLIADGDVRGFLISPDGSAVLYWADQEIHDRDELYTAPITGGTFTKLSRREWISYYFAPRFTPSGTRVVYMGHEQPAVLEELYSVPAEGGTRWKISGQMAEHGDVRRFTIDAVGVRAVYTAGQRTSGEYRVFSTLIDPDADLDGWAYICDCAPEDSKRWAAPTEATDLRLQHDHQQGMTTLIWTAPSDPGAATVRYDVLRSDHPGTFGTTGTCVASTLGPDTTATDWEVPGNSGLYFLVRGENDCPDGVGSLGVDSSGIERTAVSCP